jgi:hypothetical protein
MAAAIAALYVVALPCPAILPGFVAEPPETILELRSEPPNVLNRWSLLFRVPSLIDNVDWFATLIAPVVKKVYSANTVAAVGVPYQLVNAPPVRLTVSAALVTVPEVVRMGEVVKAPSSSWGQPMRRVMSMAAPEANAIWISVETRFVVPPLNVRDTVYLLAPRSAEAGTIAVVV